MTTTHKAAAHFAGLTTVQDFATKAEALAWVETRRAKGCTAEYVGCIDHAAEAEAHQDAMCDAANAFVSDTDAERY